MKIIIFLVLSLILTACTNNSSIKENKELVAVNKDSLILNKWIEAVVKNNLKINSKNIDSAQLVNIDEFYSKLPKDSFKTQIEFDLTSKLPKVSVIKNVIILDYSEDYAFIKFFILKDKFIYSYHFSSGNNGHSVIYDLKKQKETDFYFIDSINSNAAFVIQEKYSFDEMNPGHYWQHGNWDFKTDKITWGKWSN